MTVCGKLGMTLATRIGLLVLLSVVAAGGLAADAEKEKKSPGKPQGVLHTVDASVTHSAGTSAGTNIMAERQPGFFKVPAGQVARNFKYYFVDPKSGIERDKLNNHTIYCETTKSWVEIPADPATLELPPGEYKFVVGGSPGASGTLNFRTFTRDGSTRPPDGGGNTKPPIGNPPIRKPPPPSDTTNTGVKPDPLHPGGEGKRRVTVHWSGTTTGMTISPMHSSADLAATLSVAQGKIILEFDQSAANGTRWRWEGTMRRQGDAVVVQGTTSQDWSRHGQVVMKWRGTFTGKLTGTVLSGTASQTAKGQDLEGQAELKGQWSIKDFAK